MRLSSVHGLRAFGSLCMVAVTGLLFVASDVHAEGMRDLGRLDLNLRTQYYQRDKDQNKANAEATVQGIRLDYASPHMGDVVGLRASLFASVKLDGDPGNQGTFLLRDDARNRQHSYWKLGQAYLDMKLPAKSRIKAGRMVLNKPLLEDSDTRSTPSATQALLFETAAAGGSVYALASDRASAKTAGKFSPYRDNQGRAYRVYVIGAERPLAKGLTAHASYGFADDIKQQGYLSISYKKAWPNDRKLKLEATQYIGEAIGDGALDNIGPGYGSALSNIAAAFSYQALTVTTSYQTIKGDGYEVSWDDSHDDTGIASKNSTYRLDFNRRDEDSMQVRLDYDLKDLVKGLGFMGRYTHGTDIRRSDGRNGREWQRDIDLKYKVPDIDGLSLRARHSTVRSSETFATDDYRFVINYSRKVF